PVFDRFSNISGSIGKISAKLKRCMKEREHLWIKGIAWRLWYEFHFRSVCDIIGVPEGCDIDGLRDGIDGCHRIYFILWCPVEDIHLIVSCEAFHLRKEYFNRRSRLRVF